MSENINENGLSNNAELEKEIQKEIRDAIHGPDKAEIELDQLAAQNAQNSPDSDEPVETPAILADEFRYQRLIGEGTNGKTWLAVNILTGAKVAIKSLKLSQSENLKSFELFKREAEVLESVKVPGVPVFYKSIVSEEAGGECFIIQEYISEPSLLDYLEKKKRRFNEMETLVLMGQIADILVALHTNYVPPIIHRDIKPSNILCSIPEDGSAPSQAYLIDFGAVANPQNKSGGSTVAGTYGYMAPEQMLGVCTVASDFYGLGATALHMLTGKPPYELNADTFSLRYVDALQEYAPETSENMRALLDQLLKPEASERLADANLLITKIKNVMNGHHPDGEQGPEEESKGNKLDILASLSNKYAQYTMNQMIQEATRSKDWVIVDGIIRAKTYRIHEVFEYTFHPVPKSGLFKTVKKAPLYSGLQPVKDLPTEYQSIKPGSLPLKCKIAYNPDNPRYNLIDSIELTKKDEKK